MIDFRDVNEWHIGNNEVVMAYLNNTLVWEKYNKKTPFYIENITNGTETVMIGQSQSGAPTITIEKSSDLENWSTLCTTGTLFEFNLAAGERLYLRAETPRWCNYSSMTATTFSGYKWNYINGMSKIGGNIMSLLYGSNFTGEETTIDNHCAFRSIFLAVDTNRELIDASELVLPATTLSRECYARMFEQCTHLVYAPYILPATTLTIGCYQEMFKTCASLVKAPILPAATLMQKSYYNMFYYGLALDNVRCLATNISATDCTTNWLYNVAASGTFVKDANTTWPSGDSGIPSGWTVIDA